MCWGNVVHLRFIAALQKEQRELSELLISYVKDAHATAEKAVQSARTSKATKAGGRRPVKAQKVDETHVVSVDVDVECEEEAERKQLHGLKKSELLAKVATLREEYLKNVEEKNSIIVKVYDTTETHIRHLDATMRRFETELRRGRMEAPATPIDMRANPWARYDHHLHDDPLLHSTADLPPLLSQTDDVETRAFDIPVNPNEPVYCVCQRVSFGEMVACDNPDCRIEWFHFACVGLQAKPKGKWFCADCKGKFGPQARPQPSAYTPARAAVAGVDDGSGAVSESSVKRSGPRKRKA